MFIKKRLVLGSVIVLSCCILLGCQDKDKEVVIYNNVSNQIKQQGEEVSEKIELGNGYIKQQKYKEAKKVYEEAISKEPSNKKIYLEIKDKYVEKSRFDDAYYIIRLAINNNVDVENMKKILEEIKKNFKTISLESSVYQNDTFNLPKKVNLVVNGEKIQVDVKWNTSNVDTSNEGVFTYKGIIEQYGRNVEQNLTIKIKEKIYCNSRYGFSIEYPSNFITKVLADNKDGIILISKDGSAELTVSGINNVLNDTVTSYYDKLLSEHSNATYKMLQDNWVVLSWIEGDKIVYRKSVIGTGSINTFTIKYPSNEKETYDSIINHLNASFKTPGIDSGHI